MTSSVSSTRRADPWRDLQVIDSRAPRFNQGVVALTTITALITGFWPLFAVMGAQLAISVIFGRKYCVPCLIYFGLIQPRFGEGTLEDSRAPRFANVIGAVFLSSAALAFALGSPLLGEVLGGIVAALATLGVTSGVCVGCEVYRIIARVRGVKGGLLERIDLDQLGIVSGDELVVLFTHPLCSECQEVKPRLEREGRRVVAVDVSVRKDLAAKYGVTLVPLAVTVGADGRVRR
ncbi:MAG: DUF4395 family protein [Archangium sp.]|nr:DUF4395 family protein [Archangium sp.]